MQTKLFNKRTRPMFHIYNIKLVKTKFVHQQLLLGHQTYPNLHHIRDQDAYPP